MLNFRRMTAVLVLGLFSFKLQAAPNETKANHLEELVIWKVSDELQLKPAEEKVFAEIVRKINSEKLVLSEEIQKDISALKDEKSEKNLQILLKRHRKNLSNYSKLNEKEFDDLSKIFGPKKMSRYLVMKQDITQKIKSMLSTPENKSKDKMLPAPRIIE